MGDVSRSETIKVGVRKLRRYGALSLGDKIKYADRLIEAGLELADRPAVAWSGGKDSTVLLHRVLCQCPDVIVNFNNSGVEFPETLHFVERLAVEWSLDLRISKPGEKDFWWVLENRGYPLLGKTFTRRKNAHGAKQEKVMSSGARLSPACCWYLKEKPAFDLQRDMGIDLVFLGTMAGESRRRTLTWCDYGDVRWNKHEQIWKFLPLSIWSESDIWEYHHRSGIPACDIYSMGHARNGCWPCGMDIAFPDNHLSKLRHSHPRLWRFLMVDKGLGAELVKIKLALRDGQTDLFSSSGCIERLLEQRPDYFDKL